MHRLPAHQTYDSRVLHCQTLACAGPEIYLSVLRAPAARLNTDSCHEPRRRPVAFIGAALCHSDLCQWGPSDWATPGLALAVCHTSPFQGMEAIEEFEMDELFDCVHRCESVFSPFRARTCALPPHPWLTHRGCAAVRGRAHACGWPERFCVCPLQRAHVHHTPRARDRSRTPGPTSWHSKDLLSSNLTSLHCDHLRAGLGGARRRGSPPAPRPRPPAPPPRPPRTSRA